MGQQIDHAQLLAAAWMARETAYAPYSRFSVGAALLTSTGRIFQGCNVENVSLGLTICAERSAAVAAIQAGERELIAIAVAAETSTPIVPCGACRQFLAEFNPTIVVLSASRDAQISWSLDELLPLPTLGILDLNA